MKSKLLSLRTFELPLVSLLFLAGAAFLLQMCYLSLAFNCLFGIVFLYVVQHYIRRRYAIPIPFTLLALVFLALQIDALGNYFRMYGQQFGPLQCDEFSHLTVQILVTPVIVWLVREILLKCGYPLPIRVTSFFAATTVFSLSAFYEIIELWDEVYFGGHRIWGPHDTASDLQFDLCGIVVGSLLASFLLKSLETKVRPVMQQFES